MSGDRKPVPYIQSAYSNIQPELSPNGRFMAYATNESSTYQVVIQTFPDKLEGRVPVGEGMEPRWSHDGSELYYLTLDGKLMAVRVQTDKGLSVGKPSLLFQTPLKGMSPIPYPTRYDVAPDGQRFLMITPVAPASNSTAEYGRSPRPARRRSLRSSTGLPHCAVSDAPRDDRGQFR